MRQTRLERASLQYTRLDHTAFHKAIGSDVLLAGARGTRASMAGSVFDRLHLDNARLDHLSLRGATVTAAGGGNGSLVDIDVTAARLVRAHLGGFDLIRARFDGAELDDCFFDGVDFSGATFADARLRRVRFRWCRLDDVDMSVAAERDILIEPPPPNEPIGDPRRRAT